MWHMRYISEETGEPILFSSLPVGDPFSLLSVLEYLMNILGDNAYWNEWDWKRMHYADVCEQTDLIFVWSDLMEGAVPISLFISRVPTGPMLYPALHTHPPLFLLPSPLLTILRFLFYSTFYLLTGYILDLSFPKLTRLLLFILRRSYRISLEKKYNLIS